MTALALPESGSDFTPGPAGPGNRIIVRHLEPRLWERRHCRRSSISLELAVCVAEQQRQQPREERRSVLGSSFQRHVRWRWIFWHQPFTDRVPCAAQVSGCKIFGFSTVLAMAPQQAAPACGESCHPFELQNPSSIIPNHLRHAPHVPEIATAPLTHVSLLLHRRRPMVQEYGRSSSGAVSSRRCSA